MKGGEQESLAPVIHDVANVHMLGLNDEPINEMTLLCIDTIRDGHDKEVTVSLGMLQIHMDNMIIRSVFI
jgi:hypothetical protein